MGRIWQFITIPFQKLAAAPRKLLGLSLPAQIALLVFFFLVVSVVFVFVIYKLNPEQAYPSVNLLQVLLLIGLFIAIPLVTYWMLKLWLEGDVSRYPDIDQAWKAGLAELDKNNLDLRETPFFLIIGSPNELLERSLFDASRLRMRFKEIPHGPAALHWYANPDGVYLVCTETCCLGRLANIGYKITSDDAAAPIAAKPLPKVDPIRGTIVPGAMQADDPIRGTIAPDMDAPRRAITTSGPMDLSAKREDAPAPNIRGTMVIGGGVSAPGADDVGVAHEKKVATLPPVEATEQARRLEYVCQLIRRARQPLCPVNGILTLLPFGVIQSGMGGAREVQRATKMDLTAIQRTLQLRCPVTTLVVGMENESGFRELVRRVGRERASAQRFGKGFDKDQVWNDPTPDRLEAMCAHACGAFEDWVYALFKERGSLSKEVGNKKLYALLCKVRRDLKDRLSNLLIAVCGHDPEQKYETDPWLFGGTYFAATGDREDRQAFVAGVFEKLPEQQEEVEWTNDALRKDRFYRMFGYYAIGFDVLLALAIAAFVAWRRMSE
jgi:hypothetical protein